MTLDVGSHVGPYEIVEPLGAGGMAEVYRARDPRLGRDVAVKVLPAEAAAEPERRRRFEQEARAVAALSHPNVLAIFDVGASGVPYLVTELLQGETLRARLDRGPLDATRAIEVALQLTDGLEAAHARGIVHRDLKPENLFLTSAGPLKILDFGLARRVDPEEASDVTRTAHGTMLGTLGYMAPEQVRGLEADHRADLFACGAIIYEMLTGRRAFQRDSPADTISAILTDPASGLDPGPGTPPALASAVRRCLEKDPAHRFQSARDLWRALAAVSEIGQGAAGETSRAQPASIAVLPFVSVTADPDSQYFGDGLAEDLVNALARLSGLRVASRTSSFRYRGSEVDVRHIGRELGVGAILEGSVRRARQRLRVTAQLTSTDDGYHIWSERYDRDLADVFDVQDQIVASIVGALAPTLAGAVQGAIRHATGNLEAYDLYLQGRYHWNQRSPAVIGHAIGCFERAIGLDPAYALAYSGLADCYSILQVYGWSPPDENRPRALDAASQALALDPALAEAHFSQALYEFYFEPHWRRARARFETALTLQPHDAMVEAYLGVFLATEYRFREANAHLERAAARDPHSSIVHFLASAAACAMGDAATASRHAGRALALQPQSLGPRWPQTVALIIQGRHADALEAAEQVVARTRAPVYIGVLSMLYGRAGRFDDARRLGQELDERLRRGEYITPVARLSVELGLGRVEGIRTALSACTNGGAAPFSVVSTARWLLEQHRTDPEIDRLLDRLHDGARPDAAERQP
jgi:TolB-like protein/Tfp pilus assembly protein PilF